MCVHGSLPAAAMNAEGCQGIASGWADALAGLSGDDSPGPSQEQLPEPHCMPDGSAGAAAGGLAGWARAVEDLACDDDAGDACAQQWAQDIAMLDNLSSDSEASADSPENALDPGALALARIGPVDVAGGDFALAVLRRSQQVPDDELDAKCMEVCRRLVQDNSAISTLTKEAADLEIDRRELRTTRRLLAATALELEKQSWAFFEGRLAQSADAQECELLFYIDYASYDIADFKLQVSQSVPIPVDAAEHGPAMLGQGPSEQFLVELEEKSTGVKKIVQTEASTMMLLRLRCGRLAIVRGNTLTWLSVSDRSTAECYKACVEEQRLGTSAADRFILKLRLACTDGAGAIAKAERHIMHSRPGWLGLHFKCRVHALAGCHGKVYETLLSADTSGLIAAAKSLEPAGLMSAFRQSVRKVLARKLRLVGHVRLDEDAQRFKQVVLAAFLGPSTQHLHLRATLVACAPGDWRDPDVFLYVAKQGQSRAEVLQLLYREFVPALFGCCPKVFPRHRWVGALDTLRQIGLPMNLNALFTDAFLDFMGTHMPEEDIARQEIPIMDEVQVAHQAGDALQAAAPALLGTSGAGGAEQVDPRSAAVGATWAEQNRAYRGEARAWLATKPASRLIVMAATLRPLARFMSHELEVGGAAFETAQACKVASSRATMGASPVAGRDWPLLMAASLKSERACMVEISATQELLSTSCLPPGAMTLETQSLCCKLITKTGACIYDSFVTQFNQFPFKLFRLLDGSATAADLEQSCEASRDEFSQVFMQHFQGRLDGEEALAHLTLVVMACRTSTLQLECKNAQIRRSVEASSVHVAKPDLSWISAKFVLRKAAIRETQLRLPSAAGHTSTKVKKPVKRGKAQGPLGQIKGGRRRGGGGPWRAYVSHKCKSLGKAVFSGLSAEYKALSPEARQRFVQEGALGTLLHRQGRPAFGMVARALARASLRDDHHRRAMARAVAGLSESSSLALLPSEVEPSKVAEMLKEARADQHLLHKLNRAEKEAASERVWEWMGKEGVKIRDEFVLQSPSSCILALGLVGRPQPSDLLCVDWGFPLQQALPRCVAVLQKSEHKQVASALLQKWHNLHLEKRHADQEPLNLPPRQQRGKPPCLQAGVCLCGAVGDQAHGFKLWLDRAVKAMTASAELRKQVSECSVVLRLQKDACQDQSHQDLTGEAAAQVGQDQGEADMVDMFFLIGHMGFKPYKAICRKLVPAGTDHLGNYNFSCVDEYLKFYELALNLQPHLLRHATWVATIYEVCDGCRPLARIDPRALQARAIPSVAEQRKCFPPAMRRRQGQSRPASGADAWEAALEAVDDRDGDSDASGEVESPVDRAMMPLEDAGVPASGSERMSSDSESGSTSRSRSGSSVDSGSGGSERSDEDPECSESCAEEASDHCESAATSDITVFSDADLDMGFPEEASAPEGAQGREPPVAVPAHVELRGHADIACDVPGFGVIRYYATRQEFVAHCTCVETHHRCRLSRKSTESLAPNRAGQGRPLGLLMAWLAQAGNYPDCHAHVRMPKPDLAARSAAREMLKAFEGSELLFEAERAQRGGEADEPTTAP